MNYVIDFDLCAFVIAMITMIFFMLSPRLYHTQDNLFAIIGTLCVVINIFDIAGTFLDGYVPAFYIYLINTIYLITLHSLPFLMLIYILILTRDLYHLKPYQKILISIPYIMEMILILTSPLTKLMFFVENQTYIHGPYSFIVYICASLYIVLSFVFVFSAREHLARRKTVATSTFLVFQIIAVAIQYNNPEYLLVDLACALSLLVMYIALQSSGEISDSLTKAFNFSAFSAMENRRFNSEKPFIIVNYSLIRFRQTKELYGEELGDKILLKIVEILQNSFNGKIARTYENEFSILVDDGTSVEALNKTAACLPKKIEINGYEISLTASIVIVNSTDYDSPAQMHDLIDFAIQNANNSGVGGIINADYQLKTKFTRRAQVLDALTRAINNNSVNVVYQPIVEATTGRVVAAEALARINDPVLGPISPGEFVPLAEEAGLIVKLGKCVRQNVWDFLTFYDIRNAGIDHISVNLSSIECVQPGVMQQILAEEKYAFCEKGVMNFEITETAVVTSHETLEQNMKLLINHGFLFHLDDYGTGYSGMSNLISLPFTIVKLDKSILDLSTDDTRRDLIQRLVSPLQSFGKRIICEGVESRDQAKIVKSWGIDYIQGYLYSKPLSQDEFKKYAFIKSRHTVAQF